MYVIDDGGIDPETKAPFSQRKVSDEQLTKCLKNHNATWELFNMNTVRDTRRSCAKAVCPAMPGDRRCRVTTSHFV